MNFSEEELKHFQIFFGYAFAKNVEMRQKGRRFVHYCSAETALSILQHRQMWMRRATVMNDFREIEHGSECLVKAWKSDQGARLRAIVEAVFPGVMQEFVSLFDGWFPTFKGDTYLSCISEHRDEEDGIGRLSMWRAYGGAKGVAIVLNPNVFLTPSDALKAYTSPVAYLTIPQFLEEFRLLVDRIEANVDFIKQQGAEAVKSGLFGAFRNAVLCTKHPGFREELEWRIVYQPTLERSERINQTVKCVEGLPQLVCEIPLEDVPGEGLVGVAPKSLVNRIIIGPCQHPSTIREAFIFALANAGFEDPESKIVISDIPLRR